MKILKEHLLPAVEHLSHIVGSRSSMPILSTLYVEASAGRLSLRASSLDQDAMRTIDCEGDFLACCLGARHLLGLAHTALESIEMIPGKNGKVRIVSGWEAELPTQLAEEFPPALFKDGKAQGVSTVDLADAIDAVVWAVSDDPNRYALQGVHVVCAPKKIRCEATNGKIMGLIDKAAISAKFEFILHASNTSIFTDALRQDHSTLVLSDNSVGVRHPGGEYAAKLLEDAYVSTARLVGEVRKPVGSLRLSEARAQVQSCVLLAKTDWPQVRLSFSTTGCRVVASDNLAATNYAGEIPGNFEALEFDTDAKRLLALLKSFNGHETAEVAVGDSRQLVIFSGDYTTFISGLEKQ